MEYKQITLTEWLDIKKKLKEGISSARDKINGLKKDFVKIGYLLRQIDDNELYKQDGYKTIAEFAKAECGLSPSDTTRFIQINKKYSVGGNSEELRPEFLEYGQSKLAAMLTLPDSDLTMINPQTSREDIRELNRFNKSAPEQGGENDIEDLVKEFYETTDLASKAAAIQNNPRALCELIAPSGSRSFRKGIWFIMFHENKINIKKYAGVAKEMSWEEFASISARVLEKIQSEQAEQEGNTNGPDEISTNNERSIVGRDESEISTKGERNDTERERTETSEPRVSEGHKPETTEVITTKEETGEDLGNSEKQETEEEPEKEIIAPAQKSLKPALIPSEEAVSKEEKTTIRWDKMKHLSIPEVAEMLHMGYKSHHLTLDSITAVENWLYEEMEK